MCSNNPKKPEEPFSGYSLCPWALAGWHRLEGPSELRQLLSGQRPGVTFCSSWPGAWNFRVTLGPTALMVHQHTHTQLQDPPWEDATKQTSGLLKEFSIPPQQHGALLPRPTGIGQQAQVHAVRTQFQSLAVLRLQRDRSLVPKQQLDSAHARRISSVPLALHSLSNQPRMPNAHRESCLDRTCRLLAPSSCLSSWHGIQSVLDVPSKRGGSVQIPQVLL